MKLSEQKIGILIIKVVGLVLLGLGLYLLIHELSHLLTMLLCNGVFEDMQIGITSFVAGYVDPKFVPITAMSSLIIPLLISTVLLFVKNQYINVFLLGFTMPSLTQSVLGIFALWFINDQTRHTYDAALAYDFAKTPTIITILTIMGIVYSVFLLLVGFVRLMKEA